MSHSHYPAPALRRSLRESKHPFLRTLLSAFVLATRAGAQAPAHPAGASLSGQLPALPAPLGVPAPGPATDGPYLPQPILPGGVVVPLYPPDSPLLKTERVREPEQYNMSKS